VYCRIRLDWFVVYFRCRRWFGVLVVKSVEPIEYPLSFFLISRLILIFIHILLLLRIICTVAVLFSITSGGDVFTTVAPSSGRWRWSIPARRVGGRDVTP
jgi:hypothetical protein